MGKYSSIAVLLLSGLSSFTTAAPLQSQKRAVSADIFDRLEYFSQYSAAAYCLGNNDSPNTKITCPAGNCDRVEAADTSTLTEFENSLNTDTTGFVATDTTNQLIVISFRGSRSAKNWLANLVFTQTAFASCSGCKAHEGFNESWAEAEAGVVSAVASAQAQYPDFKVVATGHSLGGSIASLAAASLRAKGTNVDLYTYGAPRTGNNKLSAFLSTTGKGATYRTVHKNDIIPTLPPIIPILSPYGNILPEYYVTSANDVEVTANDINLVADGKDGNPGNDVSAHNWYFGDISACEGADFEFRA